MRVLEHPAFWLGLDELLDSFLDGCLDQLPYLENYLEARGLLLVDRAVNRLSCGEREGERE